MAKIPMQPRGVVTLLLTEVCGGGRIRQFADIAHKQCLGHYRPPLHEQRNHEQNNPESYEVREPSHRRSPFWASRSADHGGIETSGLPQCTQFFWPRYTCTRKHSRQATSTALHMTSPSSKNLAPPDNLGKLSLLKLSTVKLLYAQVASLYNYGNNFKPQIV